MRLQRKSPRRTRRRRRLFGEQLEDRRLLAVLDLIPAGGAGTTSERMVDGKSVTVLTVAPGTKFNVKASVLSTPNNTPVQGFQLGFRNSDPLLILNNFQGADFTNVADGTLNSQATPPDQLVGASIPGDGTELAPPKDFGSFDVTAPATAGEFTLTVNAQGTPISTATEVTGPLGATIDVSDFGDLIVKVEAATVGAALDLIPAAGVGTTSERMVGGKSVTVLTVAPGTKFNVKASVLSTPDNTPVQGFQLGFRNSDPQLVLNNFQAADFTNVADGTLDSQATPPDQLVGASIPGDGTELAPPKDFGSFDVTAPATAGEFTLTVNAQGTPISTATEVTGPLGATIDVADFGDLIVKVEAATVGAALDLIPAAGVGTTSERMVGGKSVTVLTVAPGTKFNVKASVLSTPDNTPVQGFQLGFRNSDPQLVLNNFQAADFTNVADGTLDSQATPPDQLVGASIPGDGTELAPPKDFGSFDVTAPATAGEFTLTVNAQGTPISTATEVTGPLGATIDVADFGDLIVKVEAVGAAIDLIPAAGVGTTSERMVDGKSVTVLTVAPGTKFNVKASVLSTPDNTPVQGFQLGFRNSDPQLVLNNFQAADFTNVADGTLDSQATPPDQLVGASIPGDGTELAPPKDFGSFDVTAPATAGEFTLTVNAQGPPISTATEVTGPLGATIDVTDFGDLIVNVSDLPQVEVSVNPTSVAEDGTENLVYTFTRTGDTTNALTVNYTVSGDATPGTDFTGTGSSVTIDATMTTATVTVDPTPDDNDTENDETVILTIDASSDYTVSSTAGSATGTIVEPLLPPAITWLAPDDSPDPSPLPKGPLPSLWTDQRSSFRKVQIDLQSPLASAPTASEIVLTNLGVKAGTDADTTIPPTDYTVSVSNNNSRLTIEVPQTADSSGINATLPDGVYQLTIAASATGTGQPLTITGNETNKFYVLRGDWDGDGAVSNSDSRTLAYWFLVEPQVPSQFVDLRSPVGINNQDFTLFTQAFGSFLTFPSSAAEPEQIDSADINGDGLVTSRDALNIINALGAAGEGEDLPSPLDANNDGTVTAADALFVINRLAADATRVIAGTADNDEDNSVDQLMTEEGFLNSLF